MEMENGKKRVEMEIKKKNFLRKHGNGKNRHGNEKKWKLKKIFFRKKNWKKKL